MSNENPMICSEFYRKQDGGGLRFNEDKTRFDLLPAYAMEQIAKVFTKGAKKYAPNNWLRGMAWSKVLASLERHLQAIKAGKDYDEESGLLHSSHLATNAIFLTEYYKIFPQGDDRPQYKIPRIGLDVDGVLADFDGGFKQRFNISHDTNHWFFSYQVKYRWNEICQSTSFWLTLPALIDGKTLPFEPVLYCTVREIPTEITETWLEEHGFPCVPVLTVDGNKIEALRDKVDIFVDDNYQNFVELNNAGICTYLYSRPYNLKYNVGYKRINDLKELVQW